MGAGIPTPSWSCSLPLRMPAQTLAPATAPGVSEAAYTPQWKKAGYGASCPLTPEGPMKGECWPAPEGPAIPRQSQGAEGAAPGPGWRYSPGVLGEDGMDTPTPNPGTALGFSLLHPHPANHASGVLLLFPDRTGTREAEPQPQPWGAATLSRQHPNCPPMLSGALSRAGTEGQAGSLDKGGPRCELFLAFLGFLWGDHRRPAATRLESGLRASW